MFFAQNNVFDVAQVSFPFVSLKRGGNVFVRAQCDENKEQADRAEDASEIKPEHAEA